MVLKGVLLDIDDTLLDTTGAMLRAGRVGMSRLWPSLSSGEWEAASARFRIDLGGHFKKYVAGELDFDGMRRARLAEVADHFGWRLPENSWRTYELAYRPEFNAAQVMYDDVRPFVSRCRSRGVAVGALTNASGSLTQDKLAALDARSLFDVVVTRDTLGFGKPDARVFVHACELLGSRPQRTAYVGDELEADALGARDAGLVAYWLRRPGRDPEVTPDAALSDAVPDGVRVIASLDAVDLGQAPAAG